MKLNSKETDSSLFTDLLTVTPNFAKKTSGQFFESSHRSGSGPSVPLVKRAISLNCKDKLISYYHLKCTIQLYLVSNFPNSGSKIICIKTIENIV